MILNDLKNLHKGKPAFIVGAGPSLHFTDTNILKQGITLSVNSSIQKIETDYFIGDDIGLKNWSYYTKRLPNLNTISLLYKGKLQDHASHLNPDKVVFFNHKTWYEPSKKKYHEDGLVLTEDPNEPIIGARTAAGTAVHFAFIMGCSPIVLVGCDCCYHKVDRKFYRYYWQYEGEEKPYRITHEPVFSTPNRGMYRGKWIDSHCISFIEYWTALAKQCDKQNVKIIDCSDGLLDCFEKKKLENLLNFEDTND